MTTPPSNPRGFKSGELRTAVLQTLAGGGEWTVTQLARAVGQSVGNKNQSSGAVGQACQSLQRRGQVEETATNPRRYRVTGHPSTPPTAPTTPTSPTPVTPAANPASTAGPSPASRGTYHSRTLQGISDVEALRKLRGNGLSVLLDGPPGTGKTALMQAAFPGELLIINGDGDTTTDDIVGTYRPGAQAGAFVWADGPLATALQQGMVLLLDDVTLIPSTVLAVTYPAMDGQGVIHLKTVGKTVTAQPGFLIVGCHNPGAEGAVLTAALASRFNVRIRVPTDLDLAAAAGIDRDAVKIARALHTKRIAHLVGWAPEFRDLQSFEAVKTALGKDAALANLVGSAPEEDQDQIRQAVLQATGRTVTPLSLEGRHP